MSVKKGKYLSVHITHIRAITAASRTVTGVSGFSSRYRAFQRSERQKVTKEREQSPNRHGNVHNGRKTYAMCTTHTQRQRIQNIHNVYKTYTTCTKRTQCAHISTGMLHFVVLRIFLQKKYFFLCFEFEPLIAQPCWFGHYRLRARKG